MQSVGLPKTTLKAEILRALKENSYSYDGYNTYGNSVYFRGIKIEAIDEIKEILEKYDRRIEL